MSAPTAATREAVYRRDDRRCAVCGVMVLTFQHRRAVGMGGSKNGRPSRYRCTTSECDWEANS